MSELKFWRYELPNINGEGWAIIVMCSDGFFSAVSDYGDYAHFWPHHGCEDFRQFILSTDPHQLMCKLHAAPGWPYDGDKTVLGIKRYIIQLRRDRSFDRETARKEWNLISENSGLESDYDFHTWCSQTELDGSWEYMVCSPPGDLVSFAVKTMGRLRDLIRADLGLNRLDSVEQCQ